MPALRRLLLAGWISLALLGATAGIVRHPTTPAPRAVVTVAPTAVPSALPMPVPPTTVAPAPTTTAPPPPPAPTTTTPPAPAPTTPTTARPRTTTTSAPTQVPATTSAGPTSVTKDPAPAATPAYALELLAQVVPATWRAAVPVQIDIIEGRTSWSSFGGLIQVGDWQLTSSVARARFTLAHEWGHQAAWRFGTDEYNGAGPAGFPYGGAKPEEMWADCVAQVLTGTSYPTAGIGACPGDSLSFTAAWVHAGPGTPLR